MPGLLRSMTVGRYILFLGELAEWVVQVFSIGCKIFTIAGPVIQYGIFTSWILAYLLDIKSEEYQLTLEKFSQYTLFYFSKGLL